MNPSFLYDGDCGFCSSCARFVERWIPTRARVLAWQLADLDALGVSRAEADAAVLWIDSGGVAAGPVAIARLLRDAGSSSGGQLWRGRLCRVLGVVLELRPVLWLAWPIYHLVSRHRDRLPGGTPVCALPQAERERGSRSGNSAPEM